MKQKPTAVISMGLMTLCLVQGERLRAQSDKEGSVNVTASLAGSSTVCIGEPILLKYIITNSSELPVSVSAKDTVDDALGTESFTGDSRRLLIPSANLLVSRHKSNSSTLETMDGPSLAGNSSRTWAAFANAHITFPHPGNYVLRVHVERPYVAGDREQGERSVLSGDYAFPLKVIAANPAYLQSTAEHLRNRIVKTTDVQAKATLFQALFSISEADAASSWEALVKEPTINGKTLNEIATALEALHTTKAADLLAEMLWNPVQSPDALAEASVFQHFYGMYDTGTPKIRQHIVDLHQRHGVAIPRFRLE